MLRCPSYLVVNRSCAPCTSAVQSVVDIPPRYCLVRSFRLVILQLIFWLGMKDTPSVHNEALDYAYKCDSDVEDEEVSESTNENEPVKVRRSACRRSPSLRDH